MAGWAEEEGRRYRERREAEKAAEARRAAEREDLLQRLPTLWEGLVAALRDESKRFNAAAGDDAIVIDASPTERTPFTAAVLIRGHRYLVSLDLESARIDARRSGNARASSLTDLQFDKGEGRYVHIEGVGISPVDAPAEDVLKALWDDRHER